MWIVLCLYLVTWTATAVSAASIDELPHCSRSTVMEGEIREHDSRGRPKIYSAVQLSMALHEVACMTIKMNDSESSILHTLKFLRLEQHHPVSGMYQFGIPKITSSCICDCAGGDSPCKMSEYNYRNCTSGTLCYRTYHPVQSNVGCIGEQKSEACCQLQIEPFKDWIFTAIKINQPATVLVFRYSIYDRYNKRWRKASQEVVEVPLNRGISKFDFNNVHKIEMVVSGSRPNRELQTGMYFLREGTHELRGFVPINDVGENSMEKLGWMRYTEGKWDIRNGLVKIKQAHHVNVADCKKQLYTSTINGEQLVLVSGDDVENSYDLGRPLTSDPWIETAVYQGRDVRVEHAEGTSITVYMTSETRPHMLRHISQLESFSGMIQVDRDSNRYLNISFMGSKGTLIGSIFSSEMKDQIDMAFSVQVDSKVHHYRSIISIPSSINSSRYVCFHPSGDVVGEICKWFRYEAQQLNNYRVAHRWQTGRGECAGAVAFVGVRKKFRSRMNASHDEQAKPRVQNGKRVSHRTSLMPDGRDSRCMTTDFDFKTSHIKTVVSSITIWKLDEKENRWRKAQKRREPWSNYMICNERGVDGFITSLDPRQWLNGISSPVEGVTMAVEVIIFVCLVLAFVLVCTKCLIPLLRCTFSVSKTPKK